MLRGRSTRCDATTDSKIRDTRPVGKKKGKIRPPDAARCCPRGAPGTGISRRARAGGGPTSVAGLPARPLEKVPTAGPGTQPLPGPAGESTRIPQQIPGCHREMLFSFILRICPPSAHYRLLLAHFSPPLPLPPSSLCATSSLQLSHAFTNTYSAAAFGAARRSRFCFRGSASKAQGTLAIHSGRRRGEVTEDKRSWKHCAEDTHASNNTARHTVGSFPRLDRSRHSHRVLCGKSIVVTHCA